MSCLAAVVAIRLRLKLDAAKITGSGRDGRVHLALRVAIEDEIAARHGAGDERTRLGQFAVMAAVEPAALEDFFILEIEHILVGEDPPRNVKCAGVLVHSHFERRSDVLIHDNSSGSGLRSRIRE